MEEVTVIVEADVNPTESEEKVRKAVVNLFNNFAIEIQFSTYGSRLKALGNGQEALIKFRDLLRQDRIRDAARKALLESIQGQSISFYLNKQAAFAGHVSFSEAEAESPLGPIKVTIKCNNPRQLIDWLAPKTT
ncbi:MAG: hypothetical protein N3E52_01615 [Candidatus Bathyarchaeota archaeon]|nr:hypothetical protein [Candidatus Bathyarchaeota archaeon]